MADPKEAAKELIARDQELLDKSRAEREERMKGKPTPTQEECNLAMYGASPTEHEDDGSGPDPNAPTRAAEAKPAGSYQTRQARAQPAHSPTHGTTHRSE